MSNDDRFRDILKQNGIGQPVETRPITEARWIAAQNDWWVRIEEQWYWWDRLTSEWRLSTRGPS